MAKKKTEELEEQAPTETVEAAEEAAAVTQAAETVEETAVTAEEAEPANEAKPKRKASSGKKAAEEAVAPVETASGDTTAKKSKRAEKIGVVASDKMTKTVVVRVDRLVKHPIYRKYIRKRKKFMAHDELGSKIGDKVRIVETRPLSARKRWRVVEIIQKAEL